MSQEADAAPEHLEGRFGPLLRMHARRLLGRRLQSKLDPNDIVQQTFVAAISSFHEFRGNGKGQLAAWLLRILVFQCRHAVRDFQSQKRNVALERSLQEDLEESSALLDKILADANSTPSEKAERHEAEISLARALDELPPAQREVVELRHLEGWPVADIGRHMNRSQTAIAGLLFRGLNRLRELLNHKE